MELEPQSQAAADAKAAGGTGIADLDVASARALMLSFRDLDASAVQVASKQDLVTPDREVPVRVYTPTNPTPGLPPVVYIHGGGWVLGEIDDFDAFAREIAEAAGATVVSVGYRLAPEHPFPTPIDDCWDAVQWVGREISTDGRIVVLGDSAGGNLAAVCARRARDAGAPEVVAQVLAYPNMDHRIDRDSHVEHGEGYFTTTADLVWFWDKYLADPIARQDPDASPLRVADFSGLAPAFVLLATHDPLHDEGVAYVDELRAAGVDAQLVVVPGVMHGFLTAIGQLDAADEGIRLVGEYLRSLAVPARTA
ncbi:MAG: alpha/beta hydrolase [Aeromicrobium sp.]